MKFSILFAFITVSLIYSQEGTVKIRSQYPSPMTENTRTHQRIENKEFTGLSFVIDNLLPKDINVYVPQKSLQSKEVDLLVHFHGPCYIVKYAADNYKKALIAVSINLGAGSKKYSDQFNGSNIFRKMIDSIIHITENKLKHPIKINKVILSGFSAGYGAVRKILSFDENFDKVNYVLLLDGIHASYIPERKVLFEGGRIDSTNLLTFLKFAKVAFKKNSSKKFIITHSEIFPGTFVSTTEATDYLIQQLGLKRNPVLKWGPLGMQQLSEVKANNFLILGFAGNTAPDHIDHLHSLYYFVNLFNKY